MYVGDASKFNETLRALSDLRANEPLLAKWADIHLFTLKQSDEQCPTLDAHNSEVTGMTGARALATLQNLAKGAGAPREMMRYPVNTARNIARSGKYVIEK